MMGRQACSGSVLDWRASRRPTGSLAATDPGPARLSGSPGSPMTIISIGASVEAISNTYRTVALHSIPSRQRSGTPCDLLSRRRTAGRMRGAEPPLLDPATEAAVRVPAAGDGRQNKASAEPCPAFCANPQRFGPPSRGDCEPIAEDGMRLRRPDQPTSGGTLARCRAPHPPRQSGLAAIFTLWPGTAAEASHQRVRPSRRPVGRCVPRAAEIRGRSIGGSWRKSSTHSPAAMSGPCPCPPRPGAIPDRWSPTRLTATGRLPQSGRAQEIPSSGGRRGTTSTCLPSQVPPRSPAGCEIIRIASGRETRGGGHGGEPEDCRERE